MPKKTSFKGVKLNTFIYLITGPILTSFLLLIFAVGFYRFTETSPYNQPFLAYFTFSLALVLLVNAFIEYKVKGYSLTKDGVCFKQGFWNAKLTTIPYLKIDNASINQSIFQKIYGLGSVQFEQNDNTESFDDVSLEIGQRILEQVSKKSGKVTLDK